MAPAATRSDGGQLVTSNSGPALSVAARARRVDLGLSALLILQGLTLFVAIPLAGTSAVGRALLDVCHLAFAVICIGVLARRRVVQLGLLAALVLLVGGPPLANRLVRSLDLGSAIRHELIAGAAFAFNAGVTALVVRHVFTGGRVTVHRVRGAVLLYLNVAALFAIAYGVLEMIVPTAFAVANGGATAGPLGTAAFTYFSLTTITTTGFGDIAPVLPIARSLANLEAVFGQLFPATLLARMVALHLAHERGVESLVREPPDDDASG